MTLIYTLIILLFAVKVNLCKVLWYIKRIRLSSVEIVELDENICVPCNDEYDTLLGNLAVDEDLTLTLNAFSMTGYSFDGWNTKIDGTGTSYADEEEVINLCHYTNLQLLKAKDNLCKNSKLDWRLENDN